MDPFIRSRDDMIKKKLLLIAILLASLGMSTAVQAIGLNVEVGDRGYYNHGDRYYNGDWEYVWVPGHRYHGHWIHGHYRRGMHRHNWHHHNHHNDHVDVNFH